MNVQETLAQIDHIMTEVDLELYEWQTAVDMMSFIGVNATFELWTDDIPPRLVTEEVLPQVAGRVLRVMHYENGEWGKVGTAVFNPKTNRVHTTLPNHMIRHLDSTIGPRASSSFNFKDYYEGRFGKIVSFDMDLAKELLGETLERSNYIENHPFFRTKSEPDTHEER